MLLLITFLWTLACAPASLPETYSSFTANNGVKIEYKVMLPAGFSESKSYPTMVLFTERKYDKALADEVVEQVWDGTNEQPYILIVPLAPKKNGWINHPSHHALEDFLDKMKKDYKVRSGQFYSFGYKNGTIPALTWMYMSAKYFNSVVLASLYEMDENDKKELDVIVGWQKPLVLITGEQDESGVEQAKFLTKELAGLDSKFSSVIAEQDDSSLDNFLRSDLQNLLNRHLQ